MPTIEESIEAALFAHVRDLVFDPPLPIAWPNIDFPGKNGSGVQLPTPPTYLRVQHLPNNNGRLFMKGSNPHLRQGILQLTVVSKLNTGGPLATVLAGDIAEQTPADLKLFKDGIKVRIQTAPSVMSGIKTDVSWDLPVSIRYEAFA